MSQDLTRAILLATATDPCHAARERLCAWVDHTLTPFHAALVENHLEHCPGCASLARTLQHTRILLPSLISLDPGPGFAAAVLRRTSGRPTQPALWQRLLRRPRIALETAWLGTAAGVVLLAPFPQGAPTAFVLRIGADVEARTVRLLPAARLPAAVADPQASTREAFRISTRWLSRLTQGMETASRRTTAWIRQAFRWMQPTPNPAAPRPVPPSQPPLPRSSP